jgi:hypothetical protein
MEAAREGAVKKAKDVNGAFNIQDKKEGEPHGWIQWQGTDVCMDIHCACGELSHIDEDFAFHVKCPYCGRVYFCNGHIELIELEVEPENCVQVAAP